MSKYLVYSEWDNGRGADYQFFPKASYARDFAKSEVGPDGSADKCYVDHVEDDDADYADVEVGASTYWIFERESASEPTQAELSNMGKCGRRTPEPTPREIQEAGFICRPCLKWVGKAGNVVSNHRPGCVVTDRENPEFVRFYNSFGR